MSKYNKEEIKNLDYEKLIELINGLTSNEIIELGNDVGYPVLQDYVWGH